MTTMRSTTRATAMPMMAPGVRPDLCTGVGVEVGVAVNVWTCPGEVMLIGVAEKTLPSMPMIVPAGGF